jgi:hypothetical protein
MGRPHLRVVLCKGFGAAMCSRGVLVHCPSCLSAADTVLTAELLCGDRAFAEWALEHRKPFTTLMV